MTLIPEFVALTIALVAYTAAFIGEIVRAGIQAVSHGQSEAGRSLGLPEGRISTSSSFPRRSGDHPAAHQPVPEPDQELLARRRYRISRHGLGRWHDPEPDGARRSRSSPCGMGCYLTISIVTSIFMNWYNQRIALVER